MGGDARSRTRWEYKNAFKEKKGKKEVRERERECYQRPEPVFSGIRCNSLAPHILKESLLSLCSVHRASIWSHLL